MKILSVLNPSLNDYKTSGAALLGINIGNYINSSTNNKVDFIASKFIENLLTVDTEVYIIEYNKRSVVSDTIKEAVNIFKSKNYDIMHIHIHQMSVLSAIEQYIPECIPVVYTQHTSTILGRFSLGYRDSAKYLSRDRKNIAIIMPSYSLKSIWEKYTGLNSDELDNVFVIRNGVIEYNILNDTKDDSLFACGRIDPNKKILEIVNWCLNYNHKITVVGDIGFGAMKVSDNNIRYYDNFKDLVENNKNIITWIPYASNEDIRKMLSTSFACISFAAKESFALIVAESMSVGTPVFYIEENAIDELLDENCSVRVDNKSLYNKRLRERKNHREHVSKFCTEY